jgi:hypothetical protein
MWLLDAVLQFQAFMFTRGFAQMLAAAADGNPPVVAGPILWAARLTGEHPGPANAMFATIQLLIALGIAGRRTVKIGLAASVVWALAVWWLGEGLGGVLTGAASPVAGAPGAVILYALLAVLLWPAGPESGAAAFVAARPVGAVAAKLAWVGLWASLAWLMVTSATRQGPRDLVAGMAAGEPRWIAAMDHEVAGVLAGRGVETCAALATLFMVIAAAVLMPDTARRGALAVAMAVAAVIWVTGQDFGGLFTSSATDPNSAPLLALLAAAYWPRRAATPAGELRWPATPSVGGQPVPR